MTQRVVVGGDGDGGHRQQQADECGELNVTVGVGEGAAQGLNAFARADHPLGAVECGFQRAAEDGEGVRFTGKLIEIGEPAAGLQHVGLSDFVGAQEYAWGEAEHTAELAGFLRYHAGNAERGLADLHRLAHLRVQQGQQFLICIDRAGWRLCRAWRTGFERAVGDADAAAQRVGRVDCTQCRQLEGVAAADHAGEFERTAGAQGVIGPGFDRARTGDEQVSAEKAGALFAHRALDAVA